MTNMLGLIQKFCRRRGLPVPQIGMASQDDQVMQIIGLLEQVMEDLNSRKVWQQFNKEATWNSLATESQGKLTALAPFGFKWMINGTFWNRTRKLPVYGPRNAEEWQAIKAVPMTGPFMQYRILGGDLLISGQFPAGEELVFEYASEWMVLDVNGTTYKQYFTADTDTCLIQDSILLAGLTWMWKEAKGFKYAEDFRRYEALFADQAGHDKTNPPISMDTGTGGFSPAILIPTGNWPLP